MSHVIIVGAGPAGVATAWLLAQRGIQVSLLEQEPEFDRVFRGEGLMPSGVEALEQMGLGHCWEQIPSRTLDAWDFYIDQRRRMRVMEPQPDQGARSTRIICQSALLAWLVAQAQALPQFTFYPGWQVQKLLSSDTGISGVQARHGDQTQALYGDLVIAADGRYSRSRKAAGLSLQLSPTQFDVLWFKLPAPPELLLETAFTVCLQRQQQFAFYPSWDEQLQIGWIVEKGQAAAQGQTDWIEAFASALPSRFADHFRQQRAALVGPIFLDVRVGLCPQWWQPGLLLTGDAAHPMAPNRAQGINMALRDAIAIANHLVPLGTGTWSPDALNTALQGIQVERWPEIVAAQRLQLEEWHKIAVLTASPLTYWPFKTLATLLGGLGLTQQAWLRQQRGLRQGMRPVRLRV